MLLHQFNQFKLADSESITSFSQIQIEVESTTNIQVYGIHMNSCEI